MAIKIFLSHASSETKQAAKVAGMLSEAGLEPVIDVDEVRSGSSFISFMDEAISNCAYCLLLWSHAASKGRWVKEEWQSAYFRSVMSNQSFLIVGRLEELDPPTVPRPRSWIDLFPKLEPGIEKLVSMWNEDKAAADASNRKVCPPQCSHPADSLGITIYISSKVFGKTFPLDVDFDAPIAVVTSGITEYLNAPRQHDHSGMLGCRYEYSLSTGKKPLDPVKSLKEQNIAEKSLLWLQVAIIPFSSGESVEREPISATFRSGPNEAKYPAYSALLSWSQQLGLGY